MNYKLFIGKYTKANSIAQILKKQKPIFLYVLVKTKPWSKPVLVQLRYFFRHTYITIRNQEKRK